MARVNTTDLVASLEAYLIDNWPDASIRFVSTHHAAEGGWSGTEGDRWAAMQWVATGLHQPTRNSEDWLDWDLRILCRAKVADRLASVRDAEMLAEVLDDSVFDLIDRTDGSTVLGCVEVNATTVLPGERDTSGVALSIVEVTGWARV
jgi:hypothetical protein